MGFVLAVAWLLVTLILSLVIGPIAAEDPKADDSKKAAAPNDDEKAGDGAAKKDEAAKEGKTEAKKDETAGKDDAKEKKKEEKKPGKNPLIDAIKRFTQPGTVPAVQTPPAEAQPDKKKPNRHPTDARAPYDKRADDWMRKVLSHITAGEWKEALELLQRISDLAEDSLYYRTETSKWVSVRDEAQRLRGQAPPDLLDQYRVQFGGLARQLLGEALRTGDPGGLGRVARIYFHTDAGYEAANRLGSLHLDRGEFALAAHWFAALWQARSPVTKDPLWRAKAAYALKQAGQVDLSRELVDESSTAPAASIGLGGQPREAPKWLAGAPRVAGPSESALIDWPLFYGTPRRTGVAAGGEPLLLPRWRVSTTDSHPVRTQIEHLVEDLADQGTTPLPMLFPLMVGGKVAFRTLHGVQVLDAATGKALWQSEEVQPLEKLVAGTAGQPDNEAVGGFFPGMVMMRGGGMRVWNNGGFYGGAGGDNSPLANLLFRNANFGLLSSDGRQLFVVDDPVALTNRQPGQPPNQWGFDATANSLAESGSKLTAYDLKSGRPLWEIGGSVNGEPFDLALAGHFFFGAPVADGGELFVVAESTAGESSGQIRLFSLDPRTGEKKWSQLVAASDVAIEKDAGRRWWTAQVAVGDGILVCPTTVGWLVAIDRVTHSLLWGYRPPAQGQRNPMNMRGFGGEIEVMQMVQYSQLGAVWGAAPPIIAGGRIVYTPMDADLVVCLDQFTGKELWTKPRSNALYLAGVFDKRVVVVGRETVVAFDLENGSQAWSAKITAPSGRGVTVAGRLYLPLSAGEVWSINLANGEIANKWNLPSGAGTLGNLAMYQGMLLSVDAFGLTAFEQRDAVQNEIARRKQRDPRDPWALIREAEISLLGRNFPEALTSLRQVPQGAVPAELRDRFRSLLVEVLTATIKADFGRPETDADLKELSGAVATSDEMQALRRLKAEHFVARGEYEQAFDAYLALADDAGTLVPRDDAPAVRVRSDLWVAGKLEDLRQAVSDDASPAIERRIALLKTQAAASDQLRQRFITLFRNHPDAVPLRRELAESYAKRGDFLRAEHLLLQLARGRDADAAADATERLARLMVEFKLPADAAYYYRELEQRFPAATLSDGRAVPQLLAALRDSGRFPDAPPLVLDWHTDTVRVERMGANYTNHVAQELSSMGSPAPFFASHRFEVDPGAQRLEVVDGLTDDLHWSLPLRSKAGTGEGGFVLAQAAGHHLTLLHRGVLHSLSPVDRTVLWTRALDSRGANQGYYGRNQTPLAPMQPAVGLTNRQAMMQGMAVASGTLGLANDEFVGFQGRRNVTLLDALTGEVCWVYTGVRPGTLMLGGDEVVYLRPPDGQNPVALRAGDGKRLEVKNLKDSLTNTMHVIRDNFVLSANTGTKGGLRLYDPVKGTDVWTTELARGAVMTLLENDRMAVFEAAEGKFAIVDLRTGVRREVAKIAPEDLKGRTEVYSLADNLNVYLIINKGANQNYYSEGVPFVRTSGLIFALDPQTGNQRWKQAVTGQNLMLERLTFSPFLVFASRKYENKGKLNFWSLHLMAIDKLSGTKLLDEKSAAQPGFRSVTVSAADRYVELRSYNERVRLYPVEKSAAAGQSGGE